MPIIKSAKKRMRQNEVRRRRNYRMRSLLRTHFKKALTSIKEGDQKAAVNDVSVAYSVIDTAVKKNILHRNNAARKKSMLARRLNELQNGGGAKAEAKVAKKPAAKKTAKPAAKKASAKKAEKKEEK